MKNFLRILIIEDSEDDSLLILHHIKKSGYEIDYERVDTAESMRAALKEKSWDLILCDYKMPHFDGLEALAIFKESGIDLPFIIISGTIGEDVAVEAMRLGADDYIMKDNLKRLVPAIERELREIVVRAARRHSDEQLILMDFALNHVREAAFLVDEDSYFHYVNEETCRSLGYTRAELLGMTLSDIDPDFQHEHWPERWKMLKEQGSLIFESRHRAKDGRIFPVEISANYFEYQKCHYYMVFVRDITERKRAEDALKEREEFLSSIIDNIPDMVFIKDAEKLRFVRFNRAGEKLLGYKREELIGKNDYDFFPREQAEFFTKKDIEVLKSGQSYDIPEEPVDTKTGRRVLHTKKIPVFGKDGKPAYLLGISEDITNRLSLEAQMRQAQKMESVGRLAGGVAHDFNNMLGVIIGYAELSMTHIDPSLPLYNNLDEIRKAARRSADLTRQLLAFARKQTIAPKVLDLNHTVEGMLKMLRRIIGEDINLKWLPGQEVWPIKMDPSQIDQILANLCVNARDAISGIGKVTIETQSVCFDEKYYSQHPGFSKGEYVLLAVSDNGCGMAKDVLDKLFEPFFTTKENGKGTGLGLATVYGIVKQNNGSINVYSEPGHGTTFKIYLPRHRPDKDEAAMEKHESILPLGSETILLVEDEEVILEMGKLMLEKLGYHVLTAGKPKEAVNLAKKYTGKIRLLITDVVMPEMNGKELGEKIVSLCPGLKTLFTSGYTRNVIAHHGILDNGVNFIQKPFSIQAIAAKVREVLDG